MVGCKDLSERPAPRQRGQQVQELEQDRAAVFEAGLSGVEGARGGRVIREGEDTNKRHTQKCSCYQISLGNIGLNNFKYFSLLQNFLKPFLC